MTSLTEINEFGRVDAESELQLAQFFIKTDAYARIEDQAHTVVIGRKGTGKTAIYKNLLQRASEYTDVHAVGLQFRNYPWGAHQDVQDSTAARVERYLNSWQFLILSELAKLALRTTPRESLGDDGRKAFTFLERFLRNNWGQVDFAFKDTFQRKQYSFNFEPKFAGASLGSMRVDQVPRSQLAGFLVEANRWIAYCLEHVLSADDWYFVLFDDLDRGYQPEDQEYADRLIGLILASREVFQWSEGKGFSVSPTVFLRSDIYDGLNFPDKNKITQNNVEALRWTDDFNGENSLKTLLDQRIRVVTESDAEDPWGEVFDDQVMRGTQHKFKHMASRTYLRPRDLIQFANVCLDRAKATGGARISNRNIADARPEYSEYLVQELNDEIHEAVPEWRAYLDALRRVHKLRFERAEFEASYQTLNLNRYKRSIDEVLEILYEFSIIGFTKTGGGGYGGSAVASRYKDPTISFDPGARYLKVHTGLKEALDLIEAGES